MTLRARLLTALLLTSALSLGACGPGHSQSPQGLSGSFTAQPRKVPEAGYKASFAPIVKAVAPAVVNVYAVGVVRQQVDPFWQMFGSIEPQAQLQKSLGSGVIVRPNGIVVTNNHVIEGGQEFMVVLSDRREYRAKVLLADPRTDLAVLQMQAKGETFPTLEIDSGRDQEVGDLVLAIGNPFGVGQTVTNGIISALDRTDVGEGTGSYIQTDAAINPGNSGGALVDMNGKLIGINSMILSGAGQSSGVGFAIPAPLVRRVVDTAVGGGAHLAHPWLGVKADTVTSDIAKSLGMDRPEGVLVTDIYRGGPGDAGGLRTGDVILKIDNVAVNDQASLRYRTNLLSLNQTVDVQGLRNGKPIDAKVRVSAPSNTPPRDERTLTGRNPFGGAHVVNLSPAVADELGIDPFDAPRGVMIISIDGAQSYAASVGLEPGDLIREVNGHAVNSSAELQSVVNAGARTWRVTIQRGGQTITAQFG
ncbi:MAG: trypsin-like peptidase domain-containing protein [Asticcacaulis sp.]